MNNEELIGKTIPDHKDQEFKTATKLTDIRNDNTYAELQQMPHLGIVYTMLIQCPHCGSEGTAQIFAQQLQQNPSHKIMCAHCNRPIIMTEGQALYFADHGQEGER